MFVWFTLNALKGLTSHDECLQEWEERLYAEKEFENRGSSNPG